MNRGINKISRENTRVREKWILCSDRRKRSNVLRSYKGMLRVEAENILNDIL